MFNHYLITRFNLKNPKWDVTKNNDALLTDEWMENRIDLFENFCYPSVKNQSNKNFEWLLFLDSTTSEKFRIRLEQITLETKFIKIFYIDGMSKFNSSIKEYIKLHSNQPYLITSRVDNDDCVHKNYINEIQNCFESQEYLAIDILKGFTLQIEPKILLGKKEHIFNPFISLIEKNQNPKTVWSNDHTQWKREKKIHQIKDKRLWLSIIHGKNKVNEFDGYGDVSWNNLKKDFSVSSIVDKEIDDNILPYRNWRFLSMKNRWYVTFGFYLKIVKKKLGLYQLK